MLLVLVILAYTAMSGRGGKAAGGNGEVVILINYLLDSMRKPVTTGENTSQYWKTAGNQWRTVGKLLTVFKTLENHIV